MGKVIRYTITDQPEWDAFIESSRNGTFLFYRGYMDYHSDRFADHSLMYYDDKNRLLAVLPANITTNDDGTLSLHSHQGLTYGGFVLSYRATMADVLDMFRVTLDYLKQINVSTFNYKQIPIIYHRCPSQDDDYALWLLGAELTTCNVSSTLPLFDEFYGAPIQERRRRGYTRAAKLGYSVDTTTDLCRFWQILETNLRQRYHTSPVHTLEEMTMLMNRFPNNIECFIAEKDSQAEAGIILYTSAAVAHAQYIQTSPTGRHDGALDFLVFSLVNDLILNGYRLFDFGISNEKNGRFLNTNLISQKEGFGARSTTYKQWTFNI